MNCKANNISEHEIVFDFIITAKVFFFLIPFRRFFSVFYIENIKKGWGIYFQILFNY